MPDPHGQRTARTDGATGDAELIRLLKARFVAADAMRRGICLLNAARYDEAEGAFQRALEAGSCDRSLPAYLAAALLGRREVGAAAKRFAETVADGSRDAVTRIRHALALAASGRPTEGIEALREAIRKDPERADYHFQLGTLLASMDRHEEAELRFTQAINIDRDHIDALVSLSLCCGVRNAPGEAVAHLQRAQCRRPHDARIALLLAQAARAAHQAGLSVRVRADMVELDALGDTEGIQELSQVIEAEPDFVDAFLSIATGEVDEQVFVMLLQTLERALERQPEHAELHFHCGRVLERLGRPQDAITANERAVSINPGFTRALIELGKLYRKTDRNADATTRLERAIEAGARYADVYYLLGNLYRDQGFVGRARSAYRQALLINHRYEAAIQALQTLPA